MYKKCPSFQWSLFIANKVNKPESFLENINKAQDIIYYTGDTNEVITALKKGRSIRIWKSNVEVEKLIKVANEMISFASFIASIIDPECPWAVSSTTTSAPDLTIPSTRFLNSGFFMPVAPATNNLPLSSTAGR